MKERKIGRAIPLEFESPESTNSNWPVRVMRVDHSDRLSRLLEYIRSAPKSTLLIRLWGKQSGVSISHLR